LRASPKMGRACCRMLVHALGGNIRFQQYFDLRDSILDQQLAFFQPLQHQLITRGRFEQTLDGGIEVAVFDLQFLKLGVQGVNVNWFAHDAILVDLPS
jgi:hypothetical protein